MIRAVTLIATAALVSAASASSGTSGAMRGASASSSASGVPFDLLSEPFQDLDKCTAIAVGKLATADGSTMTTHTNDCAECDIRVTYVQPRDWPAGSKRPLFAERNAYPKYAEMPEYNVHGPDYLHSNVDLSIYDWPPAAPIEYIDQVPHTYGYILGSYAIQNEKQVSMGESTCRAIFWSMPVYGGGKSRINVRGMMEIAMERCDNARCAIQTMGDLATTYGFFGAAGAEDNVDNQQNEAGEALTVTDKNEAWMFHVMPDDTGASAIWVAQRVPDDHIAVVANQFVITSVDLNDKQNFMGSDNIFDVAIRNNLWSPESGTPFNFAKIYTAPRLGYGPLVTRRVWRVFTMAAPSLPLSPYTDTYGSYGYGKDGSQPYPFSVKPDKPLTVQDVFRMKRDQYEGTQFDLTNGTDSGPFGDPMRYPARPVSRDPVNGMTGTEIFGGIGFARAISLWRTAYATVTQSRADLPDEVGALTWIAPYSPHYSTFMPIYANSDAAPSAIAQGTQYKLDKDANFWVHCLTSNYLSRWYSWSIDDTKDLQTRLETDIFARQKEIEATVLAAVNKMRSAVGSAAVDMKKEIASQLSQYQETVGKLINKSWWDYFWFAITKYRDIYKVTNPHAENWNKAATIMTYPRWWMELVGYWGRPGTPPPGKVSLPVRPFNVQEEVSMEVYKQKHPEGIMATYPPMTNPPTKEASGASAQSSMMVSGIMFTLIGAGIGAVLTYFALTNQRRGYDVIRDNNAV